VLRVGFVNGWCIGGCWVSQNSDNMIRVHNILKSSIELIMDIASFFRVLFCFVLFS
jgi:hypothetical protein